ncbi:MAG: SCO family protein [Trueperaceae bacterium]|nr:SCO family protein [Trueperaceae bacterium]
MTPRTARFLRLGGLLAAVALAGLLAFTAGRLLAPPPERVGTVLQNPQAVGDLTLAEGPEGRATTLEAFAGRADWTLVFFGFVNCPDVCPLTMGSLAETYRDLGEPDALQVALITVDPQNDDAARTHAYAAGFHPDFVGFAGSAEQIAAAAQRFFVGYAGEGRDIVHTEAVGLVDADGVLRAVYAQDAVPRIGVDLVDLVAGDPL